MVRLLDRLLPTTGVWQHAVCGRCHWHGAAMLVWSLSRPLTVTLSSHVATVRSGLGSTSKICNHANLPNEQSKAMFAIDSVLQCVDVLPCHTCLLHLYWHRYLSSCNTPPTKLPLIGWPQHPRTCRLTRPHMFALTHYGIKGTKADDVSQEEVRKNHKLLNVAPRKVD